VENITTYQETFGFRLPSELNASRTTKLTSPYSLLEYKL